MHSLLERQLRKAGFDYNTLPTDPISWQEFLLRIERSYNNADRERQSQQPTTPVIPLTPILQLQTIISAISHGLCIFNNTGQLLFMNPAAEIYLGTQSSSQLDQKQILEYFEVHEKVNPDVPLATERLLQQLANGHSFHDNIACLRQADAAHLAVSFVLNPIFEDNQIQGAVLLFSDLSEIKAAEAQLIAAKEAAEQASRAKSQFLSSMSHELRTPMNAILGYSELLKEDLGVPLEEFEIEHIEDMLQYVGNILHAGWHLLGLINKVLDLTRIEAGKLEVTIERIELIDLLKECASFIMPQVEKRAINLCNETAVLPPRYVLADRERLKQVIINLLSNAVKYNHDAGRITLRLHQPSLEYVRLEIIDTGIGLTTEQKAKVFDPFTRLSGTNLIEGTGIGLTITKHLLEIMDGRIGVDSELDVGSTFWIEVPTGEVVSDYADRVLSESRRYILLYVEDSRTNVSLVAQILKARPDIALMSAHTGEMGLELAHMHHPDIILLDINLPGMDGFEVLSYLRQAKDTCDIPVLALTANDAAHNLERGRQLGFLSYIIKPLDIKKFLKAIDKALESTTKENK
jgi:signal transduction histidine kinase/CheY-like chemotaxis protein